MIWLMQCLVSIFHTLFLNFNTYATVSFSSVDPLVDVEHDTTISGFSENQ
jgi:hypothetical protein